MWSEHLCNSTNSDSHEKCTNELEILPFIRKYLHLSTICDADHMVVINNGEIVEQWDYQQLLDRRGFYHDLYLSQFKG